MREYLLSLLDRPDIDPVTQSRIRDALKNGLGVSSLLRKLADRGIPGARDWLDTLEGGLIP